jgi:cytoskeletal protein RodZ
MDEFHITYNIMKTIGQIINTARVSKSISIKKLEDVTKIKAEFIESIEKEKWNSLPTFSIILGFVKTLSAALDVDQKMSVAVLKRDYPPKKLNINPKPDVSSRFAWNPKFTFAIGIVTIVLVILGYLGFQYKRFVSPPSLTVDSPKEDQVISGDSVLVFGSTDSDVKLTINDQPVLTDDNGKFSTSIGITNTTNQINIVATSRSGKVTTISRKIEVQLN